ncbi:recombinase family protein [Mesorhizobium sp. MSK_1335]|uniref:Recombinase family protein n=1 Tax=Mesorhizobium montanum TaxID=3072323 RepID=A0ABU4ZV82_9HYPH|nr:recombinase family protein [Mesorhizobium sp. MSK_1335]MDX8527953.1 recombinase family protein [Mesorhizobium sp. MSK_1335]
MDKFATAPAGPLGRPRIRAAQYLRMSTDRQIYSIDNQRDAIRNYANVMGYDIVATYEDPGRSGLSLGGRPGLQRLLEDVESRRADFETVVVYDVSRWGRFQNTDESASYEYRCQIAGVRIEFCAELFVNDGSIGSDVLKAIKRSMAAEYSRMLSNRVFAGQSRIVKLGFSGGGPAGYGFRRLLVDGSGNPKAMLDRNERKGLASDRVILVPGPKDEISTVRWMFNQFVTKGKTEAEIATALNARGLVTERGRPWTKACVGTILASEKYIGNNIWNRISHRLLHNRVRNPPSEFVRANNAFKPLVSRALFNRAQAIKRARAYLIPDEVLLADLTKLQKKRGKLSSPIIDAAPSCRSASIYWHRFGSLKAAYQLIGYDASANYRKLDIGNRLNQIRQQIIEDLMLDIRRVGGSALYESRRKLMRVNGEFSVAIWIARCRTVVTGYPRWQFRNRGLVGPDVTVLIRMKRDHQTVRDFLIAPAHEAQSALGMLKADNGVRLDAFLFASLDPVVEMARRESISAIP